MLKFATKSVSESDPAKALAVEALAPLVDSISKCVENVGCCMYENPLFSSSSSSSSSSSFSFKGMLLKILKS